MRGRFKEAEADCALALEQDPKYVKVRGGLSL
jgi:hypothetical protein